MVVMPAYTQVSRSGLDHNLAIETRSVSEGTRGMPRLRVLKLHVSSHVVALACSLGRKPKERRKEETLAAKRRQQIHVAQFAVAASRLTVYWPSNPWAYAQGYVLPSLRDYEIVQLQNSRVGLR